MTCKRALVFEHLIYK